MIDVVKNDEVLSMDLTLNHNYVDVDVAFIPVLLFGKQIVRL